MKSYLKIKIKSLAAESRIIRFEELRLKGRRRAVADRQGDAGLVQGMGIELDGLYLHRVRDVRIEARAAQVAYAFLRCKPYASIERPGSAGLRTGRVADLISKYGYIKRDQAARQLDDWMAGKPVV